jgi:hypothetical protein
MLNRMPGTTIHTVIPSLEESNGRSWKAMEGLTDHGRLLLTRMTTCSTAMTTEPGSDESRE